jgi:hypothetical protein
MNAQYWDPSGWEARAERQAEEAERRGRYDDAPGTPQRSPEDLQAEVEAWEAARDERARTATAERAAMLASREECPF